MTQLLLLTEKSVVACNHGARVNIVAAQRFVTIANEAALTFPDPSGKPIGGCPNIGASIKPCTFSLAVGKGYSSFVTINGRPMVKQDLDGLTDGTPPGGVHFTTASVLQTFVTENDSP